MPVKKVYYTLLPSMVLILWLVTACEGASQIAGDQRAPSPSANQEGTDEKNPPTYVDSPASSDPKNPASPAESWGEDLTRSDGQGAVVVTITPVNLDNPGDTIEFNVSLNTHSVDLSMDLAELAILRTGDGPAIEASSWDAPAGGHHIQGRLSFPAKVGDEFVIARAQEVNLVIYNLDTPERVFSWQVP